MKNYFCFRFSEPKEAKYWVEKIDCKVRFFKVGLQLFLAVVGLLLILLLIAEIKLCST